MSTYGYLRVSTTEQGDSGLGLEAQRSTVEAEAQRRGVSHLGLVVEVGSAKTMTRRPLLTELLDRLEAGDVLIVAKLDRLGRSVTDNVRISDRARREGWHLVILDYNVDTTTPTGAFFFTVMAGITQLERDMIAQRTREAMAVKKSQGFRLGRPSRLHHATLERIVCRRGEGASLQVIANELTADQVPTATGRVRWAPSQVRQALMTHELNLAATR